MRYLAMLLRVADVLELDPERTPPVLLEHREIKPASLIFWWKDQNISLKKERERLVAHCSPENSIMHRAILSTLDGIDAELGLCHRLSVEGLIDKCAGLADPLPHSWKLNPVVYRYVQPKQNSYEYIDGSFRPDTRRMLELLSGTELYGSPLAAVREIVQNAFDAVKEQIAYERLLKADPADNKLAQQLADLHSVDLRLLKEGEDFWLVCTDDGVGMTKAIISEHLLVSGRARRHDVLELERRSKQAGFSLGRTGKFGIGVLSYFMLADHIEISTLRSQSCGDSENNGWRFETDGVGSFGELRRVPTSRRGTEVRLKVRPGIVGLLLGALHLYVDQSLSHIPCKFRYLREKEVLVQFSPGWTPPGRTQLRHSLSELFEEKIPADLLPESERRARANRLSEEHDLTGQALANLRWDTPIIGDLPDDMGSYQIRIPYFDLPGGLSLVFANIQEESGELFLKSFCISEPGAQLSWKGIRLEDEWAKQWTLPVRLRVDFRSHKAGEISINRKTFNLSPTGAEALNGVVEEAKVCLCEFLAKHLDSVYTSLGVSVAMARVPLTARLYWFSRHNLGADGGSSGSRSIVHSRWPHPTYRAVLCGVLNISAKSKNYSSMVTDSCIGTGLAILLIELPFWSAPNYRQLFK